MTPQGEACRQVSVCSCLGPGQISPVQESSPFPSDTNEGSESELRKRGHVVKVGPASVFGTACGQAFKGPPNVPCSFCKSKFDQVTL